MGPKFGMVYENGLLAFFTPRKILTLTEHVYKRRTLKTTLTKHKFLKKKKRETRLFILYILYFAYRLVFVELPSMRSIFINQGIFYQIRILCKKIYIYKIKNSENQKSLIKMGRRLSDSGYGLSVIYLNVVFLFHIFLVLFRYMLN